MTPDLAAQIQDFEPFVTWGLAGIIILWFLWRVDGRLMALEKAINHNSHKLTGITRAMLIELLSREESSVAAKAAAREELAKFPPTSEE